MESDNDSDLDYFYGQNDLSCFLKDKNKKSDPLQQSTKPQLFSMLKSPQRNNQIQMLNNNQTNYSQEYGERLNFAQNFDSIFPKEYKNSSLRCKNKKNKDLNQFNKNDQQYQIEDEKNKVNIISSSSYIEISANTETENQDKNKQNLQQQYTIIQKNVQDQDINQQKIQNMTNDGMIRKNQLQQHTYEDTENDSNEQIIVVKNKSVNINIEIEPVHAQQKIVHFISFLNDYFSRETINTFAQISLEIQALYQSSFQSNIQQKNYQNFLKQLRPSIEIFAKYNDIQSFILVWKSLYSEYISQKNFKIRYEQKEQPQIKIKNQFYLKDNNWFTRIIQERALIMMNSINHLRQMPNKILWESWRQVELEQYWHYFNGVRYHCISKRGFHKSLSKQPDAIVLKENSGSLHYFRQNQQLIPACSICHYIGEYYLRKVQYYRLFVAALKNFKKKSLFRKEILLEMLLEFLTDKQTLQNQIFFLQKPKFLDKIEQMKIKQKEQEESLKQMKQQKLIEKCGNENFQNEQNNQENDDDNSYLEIELEQKKSLDYNNYNSTNNQKVQKYQEKPGINQNQKVNINMVSDNFDKNDHQFQFENEIKQHMDKPEQVYISSQEQLKQLLEQQKKQSKNKKTIKLSQKLLKQLLKMQQENDNQDSDLEQSSEKLYKQNNKKDKTQKLNKKIDFKIFFQQQQQQQIKQPTINLQQKNANQKINQDENKKFEFQNKDQQFEQEQSEEVKDGLEYNWQSNLNKLKQIYINPKKYNQLCQNTISHDSSMGSDQNLNLNTQNQNKIKEDTQQIMFTNNHINQNNAQKNIQKKQKFQDKE